MIIISSDGPYNEGEIIYGIADDQEVYHPEQPMMILREATAIEFLNFIKSSGLQTEIDEYDKYFYEVSID